MSESEYTLPISSEKVVPHKGKMRFIDTLEEWRPDYAAGFCTIREDNPFYLYDFLHTEIYPELVAQLAAAARGYYALINHTPAKMGALVGITNFKIAHEKNKDIKPGDKLHISYKVEGEFGSAFIVNGKVVKDTEVIASGFIKIWEYDKPPVADKEDILKGKIKKEEILNILNLDSSILLRRKCDDIFNELIEFLFLSSKEDEKINIIKTHYQIFNDFSLFPVHFENYPIFPGVCLLRLAILPVEMEYENGLQIISVNKAKFSEPLFPDSVFSMETKYIKNKKQFDIESKITDGSKIIAEISATCKINKE